MIKEIKIPSTAKSSNFLKDFSPHFADLLEKVIVFNPNKRLKIEEILNHEVVKAFHKPEEEISCKKIVSTSVDDNKKLSVDEYRKLIYGSSSNPKPKGLSTSLGSNSAKYLPSHNKSAMISTSTHTPSSHSSNKTQNIDKPEMTKKYSHQKIRTNTVHTTYTKVGQEPFDPKKYEKPVLKYVRSNKDITKSTETFSHTHNSYKKFMDNSHKGESQVPKKEEKEVINKSSEVKKQSQSSYLSSHNPGKSFERASKEGLGSPTVGAWKALKTGLTNNMLSPK